MRTGYYGRYARCRNISTETAIERIKKGEPYIIRFKSEGDFNNKIIFEDLSKGKLSLSENDLQSLFNKIGITDYDNSLVTVYLVGNKNTSINEVIDIKNIKDI